MLTIRRRPVQNVSLEINDMVKFKYPGLLVVTLSMRNKTAIQFYSFFVFFYQQL